MTAQVKARRVRRTWTMTEAEYRMHVEDYDGVCLACGEFRYGDTEGDAEGYECESCGESKVMGIENAMIEDRIRFEGGAK